MKLLIIICSLFLSVSAFAGDLNMNELSSSGTMYQKIAGLYDAGTLVNPSIYSFKGVAGRCFTSAQPNQSLAAIYVSKNNSVDVGPIADPIVSYFVNIVYNYTATASYYDNMTYAQMVAQNGYFAPLTQIDERTYAASVEKNSLQIRQGGDYLVAHIMINSVEAYCYYFKIN